MEDWVTFTGDGLVYEICEDLAIFWMRIINLKGFIEVDSSGLRNIFELHFAHRDKRSVLVILYLEI